MTTATPAKPAAKKRKGWLSDLFFLRRRPVLRGVPLEWDRPDNDEAYQKLIDQEGFISSKFWDRDNIGKDHPIIAQDLSDLDQYLLPTFFEFSQKSKYYQNQFYLYQWVFICGAFLTTVFGALATLFYAPVGDASTVPAAVLAAADRQAIQMFFSYLTAIIGAITAFTTALSNRGEPQKRWGKTRRLAEELRMHYFNYLSHIEPYDKPDRVQKLRENVINIRVKEQENV